MATASAEFAQHGTIAVGLTVATTTAGDDSPATNEVQTLIAAGNNSNAVTGGTFTITFDGQTTSALAYNADGPTTIEAAMEGLSSVGAGNIDVTGTSINTGYTFTFKGTLAATDVAAITASGASLTAAAYCDIVTLTSPHTGVIKITNAAATNTITAKIVPRGQYQGTTIAALEDNTYRVPPTGVTGLDAFVVIGHGGLPVDVYLQCPAKQAYSVESIPGTN